jgi:HEAT repeat protein
VKVRQAASEALVQTAGLLDTADLGRHVLTVVLQLAHDDEREDLRVTAVRTFCCAAFAGAATYLCV